MSGVALVRNPHSTRNRRLSKAGLAALPEDIRVINCDRLEDLSDRLREAHREGAGTLLVDGGDGTLREVVSRLPAIWGTDLPEIGILPRGNTNLLARQAGAIATPDAVGEILHRRARGIPLVRRRLRVLKIEYPDGEHPAMRGFILGWGAYETATRIAREQIRVTGRAQVPLAIAMTVRRLLVGEERRQLRLGVGVRLGVDGNAPREGRRLVGLATSLQARLLPGINPFWGGAEGAIRWLDIDAPGKRLLLALPFVLTGRPRSWMREAGYRSGRAQCLSIELRTPVIIDGDAFPPPTRGPLRLTADEEITFISL